MTAFRIVLICFIMSILSYTGVVISNHGWNLFPEFFGEIWSMTWSGQFNVDFTCFLTLSGIWVAWRHGFSRGGLVLGVTAFFGGMMFLAPYLLVSSFMQRGNMSGVLLGVNLKLK